MYKASVQDLACIKSNLNNREQQSMQIKLHSIGQLHAMFPEDVQKDIKVSELTKLVEEHGTYRKIGKARFLTDDDVRLFFSRLSEFQYAKPIEPGATESGLIVAYGDPLAQAVIIDWCPRGHELMLLDTVRAFCEEKAMVLGAVDMTYGDYKEWRAQMRTSDHWDHGKWFFRAPKVMSVFQTDEKGA